MVVDAPAHDVIWTPHQGPQRRFLASSAYECLYGGAAGGGKTDALIYGLLRQTAHPQYKGLFLRQSFPQLREVMDRAHFIYPQLGAEWKATESRYIFPSGSTIEFGFCETLKDASRYVGQEFTEISYDELGLCPDMAVWTFLMSRNRSTADGLVKKMRASANPGGKGHIWLKRRFVDFCNPDGSPTVDPKTGLTRAFIPARLQDNPTLMLGDPMYVQRLQALPDLMRKQLLDGDWHAGEGAFFSEFNEETHMIPKLLAIPSWWPLWSAFDWGFAHPFAGGAFTINDDGQIILLESVHGRRMLPDDIAQRMARTLPPHALIECYAGHDCFAKRQAYGENTPSIADTFMGHNIYLNHAAIDRVLGWQTVMRLITRRQADGSIGMPKFLYCDTPSNRKTAENMRGMIADPDDPDDLYKVDADAESGEGGDDPSDMVRYGLATHVLKGTKPKTRENPYTPDQDATVLVSTPIDASTSSLFDSLPEGF